MSVGHSSVAFGGASGSTNMMSKVTSWVCGEIEVWVIERTSLTKKSFVVPKFKSVL